MRANDGRQVSVENACGSWFGDRSHGVGCRRSAWAIDVVVPEDARKAPEVGRAPMEKAGSPEDVKILQQASLVTRVGRSRKTRAAPVLSLQCTSATAWSVRQAGSGRIEKSRKKKTCMP